MFLNRKLKVLLACCLALCLMVSVGLTSCGGAKEEAGENTAVEETEPETETEQEEATDDDMSDFEGSVPKYDEEGSLTEDEALEAALKDAGLSKDEIQSPNVELDADDEPRYYVQFLKGETEYDYTINAKTGEVIDKDVVD